MVMLYLQSPKAFIHKTKNKRVYMKNITQT